MNRATLIFAALALLVSAQTAGVRITARAAPPDVRGVYLTAGLNSIYDCTIEGADNSQALFTYVNVPVQDGSFISGSFGGPDGEAAYLSFTADLADDGTFAGQWFWLDPQVNQFFQNQVARGRFAADAVEIELTGTYGIPETFLCEYRISLSSEASILTWQIPDPNATAERPPPRALTIVPLENEVAEVAQSVAATLESPWSHVARQNAPGGGLPTGYNVYRSKSPNVQTTPQNLFTSVPASQTTVPAPNGTSGSFFVVTATFPSGESVPSNEVSGGVEAATLTTVKVTTKIKASGTGFSPTVQVFVDGIPFSLPAKVKNGTKVTQKGTLITGQTLTQYITQGRTVAISFRNQNGGVATRVYTKP